MKNSSFDRWIVIEVNFGEFEHPYLGSGPEYGIQLKMKDGSLLELVLSHPSDRMSSCYSSWMSYRDRFDGYYSALHYYRNTNGNYRCDDVCRYLICLTFRFGHRYDII